MSDFQFGDVGMLHGLWLLVALAGLMVYASRRRRQALRAFVEAGLLARLGGSSVPDPARRVLKAALVLAAVGCLVLALARPAWDAAPEEVVQRGRDVVFLLDVSRSMLAEDLRPNRLERAKLAILDAVDRLGGDRVALAVFAGSTVVKCPLTLDYGFFRQALADVSPFSVARGGTLIGDGLRTVLKTVFDSKSSNFRDIVLITDGEDHESFPVQAAEEARTAGVRLIAIGLGDERVGHRVPVIAEGPDGAANARSGRTFLLHEGQEVWSKLDAATLRRMAEVTPGGVYLNVATGAIDLGEVYRRLIASAEGREVGSLTVDRLDEKFQVFLAICILLLALETALRERKNSRSATLAGTWLIAGLLVPAASQAASVRALVNDGNKALRSEEYEEALRSYDQALEQDPDSPFASLNRANALYRSGQYAEAAEAYTKAVGQSSERGLPHLKAAGLHNRGNALYRQAEQVAPKDPGRAIQFLAPAARSYLDALRTDASRPDSAHNLEVTRRFIQELREQASQRPSAGRQGDQDDDSEEGQDDNRDEALHQAAEEQERLADESEQLERDRRQQRGSDSREEQQQRAQALADRQEDLRQRTQQLAESADQGTRERIEDAARHQQQAQQDLEQSRPNEAEKSQRQAAEALRQAATGEEAEQAQSPEQAEGGIDPSEPSEQAQQVTVDQILAKELQDRRTRQLRQRVGAVAVEKDW